MESLEFVVVLGLIVLVGTVLASRLRIAAPFLLIVLGLVLSLVPQAREIEFPPETVLLVFLPVMLFWESLTTSLRAIRRNFRGIVIMSTLLVVATAFAVAGVAALLGVPWSAAFILGAALAPPDATAVAALGRMMPRRNFLLLKAESLTNDGTALVLYAIAVGVAVGETTYTPLSITGLLVLSYGGGAAAGAVVAWVAYLFLRRRKEALTINTTLIIVPFLAFVLAEFIQASGVLAVVVAGLGVSLSSHAISTAASRRQTESIWPMGSYLLNSTLFVLVGLQVGSMLTRIETYDAGRLILITVLVWVALVVVRFVFQTVSVTTIRLLDRRPAQRRRRMTYRARVVSTVAGFRGAVSLAIALSVPLTVSSGEPFPGRDDIIVVTAGVIVLTLLVQGPLLPFVVRWARLPHDSEKAELGLAEQTVARAALTAVTGLAKDIGVAPEVAERLAAEYRAKLGVTVPDGPAAAQQGAVSDETRLRLAMLAPKREALLALRRHESIDDAVARRIQTRLDVEEQRLTGVEPVD